MTAFSRTCGGGSPHDGCVTAMKSMPPIVRKVGGKLFFSLLLMSAIFYFVDFEKFTQAIFRLDFSHLVGACAFLTIGQMLNSWRWRMLIRSVDNQTNSIWDLFVLNLVGMYYNFFAPSSVGGDVLQAETAKRHLGGRADAYVTIVLNRVLALFAVCLLAVLSVAAALAAGWASDPIYVYVLIALAPTTVVGVAALFYAARWVSPSSVRRRIGVQKFARLLERFRLYLENRSIIAQVLALAVVSNVIGQVLVVWSIAVGTGLEVLAIHHFVNVPIIILVTLVPISLNGIGLREAAFIYLYGLEGVASEDALAMSAVLTALMMAFGLVGGLATLSPRYALSLD